jgi:excisionase family DNA binding protein
MESSCPYLTIRETATLLAFSTRTIHRYIAGGKLKAYLVAGEKTIRIKREDVDALLSPIAGEGHVAETDDEHTRPRTGS